MLKKEGMLWRFDRLTMNQMIWKLDDDLELLEDKVEGEERSGGQACRPLDGTIDTREGRQAL